MTPGELIRALGTVPEKRLRILELVSEVVDENGNLDREQVTLQAAELQEAIQEARAYKKETERLRWGLKSIMDR